MDSEAIRAHIVAAMKKKHPESTDSDEWFLDFLAYSDKPLYQEDCGDSRWWKNVFRVTEIDSLLIGYDWAETTGDDSPRDKGWEFDPKSLCEVEPHTETITRTTYKVKA